MIQFWLWDIPVQSRFNDGEMIPTLGNEPIPGYSDGEVHLQHEKGAGSVVTRCVCVRACVCAYVCLTSMVFFAF